MTINLSNEDGLCLLPSTLNDNSLQFSSADLEIGSPRHDLILFLISLPRSKTTAFERSIVARGDFYVFHEPFQILYSIKNDLLKVGTDKISEIILSSSNQDELWNKILTIAQEQPVFIKDFAHRTRDFILNKNIAEGKNIKITFLIRDPLLVMESMYRMEKRLYRERVSYKQLWEIFEYVKNLTGINPIVVEAESLNEHSAKQVIQEYTKLLGINFLEQAMAWPSGMLDIWTSESWYVNVANSNGFKNCNGKAKEPIPEEIKKEMNEINREVRKYYDKMLNFAISPIN
jgi:hypothetical protein